jgi:hypothetical protein
MLKLQFCDNKQSRYKHTHIQNKKKKKIETKKKKPPKIEPAGTSECLERVKHLRNTGALIALLVQAIQKLHSQQVRMDPLKS